ncbi:hypothetical protein [Bordetella genomosp. 9]|uniref:hypothetical protein n=1 Tax=Bordetella genomosp. 9 TaxID=1416803 RepID=UPI0012F8A425|nr:hypothetical protein [Bordetella genomosp. 9]
MQSYPSVNWWPGLLRPHESRLSLVAKFCALNGITVAQCKDYFSIDFGSPVLLAASQVKRIACLLNEDLDVVKTVFRSPLERPSLGEYRLPPINERCRSFRYCEGCARFGYHSYLHELPWLFRCPFHLTELSTAEGSWRLNLSIMGSRVTALSRAMQARCAAWPRTSSELLEGACRVAALEQWVRRVGRTVARTQGNCLWKSDPDPYGGGDLLAQTLGQLHALCPIPDTVAPLVTPPVAPWGKSSAESLTAPLTPPCGPAWRLEVQHFSPAVRDALIKAMPGLGVEPLFYVYNRLGAVCAPRAPFVTRLKVVQRRLRQRHRVCKCQWTLVRNGWEYQWARTDPRIPYAGALCPFNVALQELACGWGRFDLALSPRLAEKERFRFLGLGEMLAARGLCRRRSLTWTSDYRYASYPWEWVQDSLLTELFDRAARWEIESASRAVQAWLDGIEAGRVPSERNDPRYCVSLHAVGAGLSLLHWTTAKKVTVDRQNWSGKRARPMV